MEKFKSYKQKPKNSGRYEVFIWESRKNLIFKEYALYIKQSNTWYRDDLYPTNDVILWR